ncbi:hypothetical protein C4K18_5847 [Pseudomonas chlororaphis subsp. aurantiaca]|uniref:DUF3077 domain-containing protein n=1 Tax=Pseudomonas chlororaphis TaxID=587753 RepID=UPI000BE2F670|nr:DUF3077 domain-containing protein [Pseudomonas chlororaphis]AZD63775.1 hypothetical protein C4K18_5847 [Pseudomonas chlororaphis subsp. aurantiaca]AZD89295.1 hypothetical protein C4K14_6516 [Pseudomonas chlororaphis subsp. aureofaciens]
MSPAFILTYGRSIFYISNKLIHPDIPGREALKHASNLFYYAKKLMLDTAMEERGERYAWPAYYLCKMGKAVVDDLTNAILSSIEPQQKD